MSDVVLSEAERLAMLIIKSKTVAVSIATTNWNLNVSLPPDVDGGDWRLWLLVLIRYLSRDEEIEAPYVSPPSKKGEVGYG